MLTDLCKAFENHTVNKKGAKALIDGIKRFFGRISANKDLAKLYGMKVKDANKAIDALEAAYKESTKSDALKKKNPADESGETKYAKKVRKETAKANKDEADTIKKQILASTDILDAMEPVAIIYDPFDTGTNIDEAVKWLATKSVQKKHRAKGLWANFI